MAENSGFFDAHLVNGEYDRVYLAESFAKYFASFIGNGIFGGKSNELMVKQKVTADMSVRVLSGQGWINGYWYENSDELSLAIDIADGVLNRIDIIVLRWDNSERVIRLAVKKGTSATSPSAPAIQRGADLYELKLAQVYVKAGTTKITQADITDTRLNNEVCGFVHGVIDQFDTTEFGNQIDSFIENFEASNVDKMQAVFDRINSLIDEDMATRLTLDVDKLKSYNLDMIPLSIYLTAGNLSQQQVNISSDNLNKIKLAISNKVPIILVVDSTGDGMRSYFQLEWCDPLPDDNNINSLLLYFRSGSNMATLNLSTGVITFGKIGFTIADGGSNSETFSVAPGTTWEEWVGPIQIIFNNSLELYIYGGVVATEGGVYAVSLDGRTAVRSSDTIIPDTVYTIINWGG